MFHGKPRVVCSPKDATQKCQGRTDAQKAGEIFYQVNGYHPGWKYPVDTFSPFAPPIFSWTHCPWCDHELPGYEYVMKKILDEGEGPE